MFHHRGRAAAIAVMICSAITMSGCSRSISVVKDADAPNEGFKIGQVLDHKPNCLNSSWSQGKDANDRPFVEFKCEVQIPDQGFAAIKSRLSDDAKSQFEDRIKRGPYITKENGSGDDHPLSEYGYDQALAHHELERSNPEAAKQLDQAKAEFDIILQDLAKVDASCGGTMAQRQADFRANLDKYLANHAKVTEVIQFVLKDDQIVERNLSAHFEDGTDALPDGTASWLYRAMLTPNDPTSEYAVLTSRLAQRADVGDIKYCGKIDAYRPFAARVQVVANEISAATDTFRRARGLD